MGKALIDERKVTLARNKSWASFVGALALLVIIWGICYLTVNKYNPEYIFCFYLGFAISLAFKIVNSVYLVNGGFSVLRSERIYMRREEPRFWDSIQKAIASFSLPTPKIYLSNIKGMNAWSFCLGLTRFSYAGVTKELIKNLNNEELDFVTMHEMSHIANRDGLLSWSLGVARLTIITSAVCLGLISNMVFSIFMLASGYFSVYFLYYSALLGELHADAVAAQKIGSIKPAIDTLTKAGLKSSDIRFKALKQLELRP